MLQSLAVFSCRMPHAFCTVFQRINPTTPVCKPETLSLSACSKLLKPGMYSELPAWIQKPERNPAEHPPEVLWGLRVKVLLRHRLSTLAYRGQMLQLLPSDCAQAGTLQDYACLQAHKEACNLILTVHKASCWSLF